MGLRSLLRRLTFREDKRPGPTDDYWYNAIAQLSATGVNVTPDNATRCAAVLACVRVLSETVAGLPLILYKRDGESRVREPKHPLYNLLHTKPNRWQTSFEFREMMMGHLCLRGNSYARKVFATSSGDIAELVPLNPTRVTPMMDRNGDVVYEFRPSSGGTVMLPADEVFHLKAFSNDGLVGLSPIALAKETVGLSIAAEEFGARTFANDAQPGGVLEHPAALGADAIKRMRETWASQHGGVQNARKPIILEEGMKWSKVGMSADDTQFIETRKFQIEEIARIFRVPPHLIGHLEKATFSNIEHQALEFVTHTIIPWLCRWEQAISARLFSKEEQQEYYVEFLVDGLLRGDIQTRYNAYAVGRQWGWLTVNEVRRFENADGIGKEGDVYLVPMNMVDASRLDEVIDKQVSADAGKQDGLKPDATPPAQPKNNQSSDRELCLEPFTPVLEHLLSRYVERVQKSKKPLQDHVAVIREGLVPAISGMFILAECGDGSAQTEEVIKRFIEGWESTPDEPNRLNQLVEIVRDVYRGVASIKEDPQTT